MAVKLFDYTCIYADDTGGRCQKPALIEESSSRPFSCIEHLKMDNPPVVPETPEWILFQFIMSEKFREGYLENSDLYKTENDVVGKLQKRVAEAERIGRDPRHFFPKRAYNGSPVFGKSGLRDVGMLWTLRRDLEASGYQWVNAHWYEKVSEKKIGRKTFPVLGAVVVFGFRKNPQGVYGDISSDGEKLLEMMTREDGYSYAHVHANAPNESGEILHSIEMIGRREGQAEKCHLVPIFMEGMWYAVPPQVLEETLRIEAEATPSQ